MKFRCIFVSDRKQVRVPGDSWHVFHSSVITPPRGKPKFMVLLTDEEPEKKDKYPAIGFNVEYTEDD